MTLKIAVAVVVAALLGCGASTPQYQKASSGPLGCAPEDIQITNESSDIGVASWTAKCRGKVYYCSATGQGSTTCNPASAGADSGAGS